MYGSFGTKYAKKMMLLGSGELGKEVVIEAQRLGVETIAVDRYADAPAMQVAHRSYVLDMLNGGELKKLIHKEQPDLVVPEIEAIATEALLELELEGIHVVPTARATKLTMDREGIRRLAAQTLRLPTAKYAFAENEAELQAAIDLVGLPCVIKPIMSSSGKGQSVCRSIEEVRSAFHYAERAGRVKNARVIVEEFIQFDSEITLLTIRSITGTHFCPPIGHIQKDGDYVESWQPHGMMESQLDEAKRIAKSVTDALGGLGVFGVELFLTANGVYFSEVSPRPHDTGLVTLGSQYLSEFALHVRAIMGFPITEVDCISPAASRAIKATEKSTEYQLTGIEQALAIPSTQLRFFGKPTTTIGRRMAVIVSRGESVDEARQRASEAASQLNLVYKDEGNTELGHRPTKS